MPYPISNFILGVPDTVARDTPGVRSNYDLVLGYWEFFQNFFNSTYKNGSVPQEDSPISSVPESRTGNDLVVFDQYITIPDRSTSDFQGDPYASYCQEPINRKFDNLLDYWNFQEADCLDLAKTAHFISAMSAKYERVCS